MKSKRKNKVNQMLSFISLETRHWEQEFNKDGDSEFCLGHSLSNMKVRTRILSLIWSIQAVREIVFLDWQHSKIVWGALLWLIYRERESTEGRNT